MAAPACIVSLLLLTMMFEASATNIKSKPIQLGSSLFPHKEPTSWLSPSGSFAFGFYKQGGGFLVGTWLTASADIIVWTANRNDPPVSSNSTLTLTMDGQLILRTTDRQSKDKIIAKSSEPASFARMFDSGNFALYNHRSQIIWSSFNFPTDTILGGQTLYTGKELISSVSETNSSTGRFCVRMQGDGNLVSYPTNTGYDETEAYWASGSYSDGHLVHGLYLNYKGELVFVNNKSEPVRALHSDSSPYNSSIIYQATLGHDGIFRLYSHYGESNTSLKWREPEEACLVKTFCGWNSYCTLYDDQPGCRCLPGTDFVDPDEMNSGCERYYIEETCAGMNTSTELYNLTSMERITWDDYPYFQAEMDKVEDCGKSCSEDCNCDVALYKEGICKKQKLPLRTARRDQGEQSSAIAFFKLSKRNITSDAGGNFVPDLPKAAKVATSKKTIVLILVMTVSFITCSCIFLGMSGFFVFKYRVAKYKWLLETGNFGSTDELTMRSFSYNELKKATKGFKEELGRGSFGAVYKGSFYKGEKLVAVKRLEKMMNDGSEREFHAEMQVIGRIHHKNLVRLLGYCAADSKRLLLNKLVRDEVDKKILENMLKVGLWCVQDEPALRPSMKSVVMMLEGITDVSIPPCPTSSSG
ncbi:hypothetical protein Patl1_27789 [Pistacia atlantica]|uniref:Uncharacterized protein n=1 Tax=Pistacia atlantica TaxID=434234 RepID=A0ACC1BH78_9ROSI|nr:hypothetical protein Patl1_27789 [Pistacia atlantica]